MNDLLQKSTISSKRRCLLLSFTRRLRSLATTPPFLINLNKSLFHRNNSLNLQGTNQCHRCVLHKTDGYFRRFEMKKMLLFIVVLAIPVASFAQFKSQTQLPSISAQIAKPASNLLLGFLDPNRFQMHHSFSMSYATMGGQGMMVNSYMNTIDYQISNPLFLRLNLGLMNSPINSFNNPALDKARFFGSAELSYRPSDNTLIQLGIDYRPGFYPGNYYNNYWGNW